MIDLDSLCNDLKRSRSPLRRTGNRLILQLFHLLQAPTPQTHRLLTGWEEEFQAIYGDVRSNLSSNRKLDAPQLLQEFGVEPGPSDTHPRQVQLLFFSIQTYFSLLVKLIAREALECPNCSGDDLILGRFALIRGIENYCTRDWFCWPAYEDGAAVRPILSALEVAISPYHTQVSPAEFVRRYDRDCIKQIYHALIPKALRHALGEFYTPDWLARLTWRESMSLLQDTHLPALRVLDPTCGSGTFLFQAIYAKRAAGASLPQILDSVTGIDINPLAVLTAKTNYLLSILDLLEENTPISLPVFQADLLHLPPLDIPKADLIVGNPPWVNWEYLPEGYRARSQHLWQDYQLFLFRGKGVRFAKEDISILITYLAADQLLRSGGLLSFVIRQGVFKSAQNGAGFRRFRLPDGQSLGVLRVDDLSKLRVFDHAAGSTALFFVRKGEDTTYPVPYLLWKKRDDTQRSTIKPLSTLEYVLAQTQVIQQQAMPASPGDLTSPWVTADRQRLESISSLLGQNNYQARTGVFTGGANAVYWLDIVGKQGSLLRVQNITRRAKRKAPCVQALLEPDHIYPLVLGRGIQQWHFSCEGYILCPHTAQTKLWPVPGHVLHQTCPNTYDYLSSFREELDQRKGFASWEKEIQRAQFHAVLKVGAYTFSKYKVAWRYIASRFLCAVIEEADDPWLGRTIPLPNEKVMYVSTDCREEAYFLCGLLSSTPVAQCVQSYMNPTSISAHVLGRLRLPDFDEQNPDHLLIAQLCRQGHQSENKAPYLAQIDAIVERLYRLLP